MKSLDMNPRQLGLSLIELLVVLALVSMSMQMIYASFFNLKKVLDTSGESLEMLIQSYQLTHWFKHVFNMAGSYNSYDARNLITNLQSEFQFIQNHPIVLPGDFIKVPNLGSMDAISDKIVINALAEIGCNGQRFHYQPNELFHVVNEIYVDKDELRCRSYDGRYLTGAYNAQSRTSSVSLIQGVNFIQAKYLVLQLDGKRQYVDAEKLQQTSRVLAVKLELWLKNDGKASSVINTYSSILSPSQEFSSSSIHKRLILVVPIGRDELD